MPDRPQEPAESCPAAGIAPGPRASAKQLLDSGAISAVEFEQLKASALTKAKNTTVSVA
jgi:hypothetical protein